MLYIFNRLVFGLKHVWEARSASGIWENYETFRAVSIRRS
jgi:hypothetical protein